MNVVDLIMGIDMGTTHVKVATFDLFGNVRTLERRRTPTVTNDLGWGEYDARQLWRVLVDLVQTTTRQLKQGEVIHSISVGGMAEAGLLLDQHGGPLTPVFSWFDSRGREVYEEWFQKVGLERFFSITGLNANHVYSVLKILWLKSRQPKIYRQAKKWLCLPDYVYFCLTGEYKTDYSIASRTGLFEPRTRSWSKTLLDLAGIDSALLPSVEQSGTLVGFVRGDIAAETGLPLGCPVSLGGHDHVCGALAANVVTPGSVLNSMGTSESVIAVFQDLPPLERCNFQSFNVGCHVVPDTFYIQGGASSNGISIEWFLDQFSGERRLSYQDFMALAKQSPVGSRGVFFVPHLRGGGPPERDPNSAGSFSGIREYHSKADLARSVQEGLAFEAARIMEGVESVLNHKFETVRAIGGGTNNELWMSIKSALANRNVEIPVVQEATLLGVAILGGIGAGLYKDHDEAIEATHRVVRTYAPEERLVASYGRLYSVYREVLPLSRKISNFIQNAHLDG